MGFVIRWIFAFVLLAVTYNPTQWNYVRWAMDNRDGSLSLVVLGGLILLIGYIIYLRATLRSIGLFGMILILIMLFEPLGIFGMWIRTKKYWKMWPF